MVDMAQTTIRTDDIDKAPDAEECFFLHEGTNYSIDLAGKNLEEFKETMSYYAEHGTKVVASSGTRTRRSGSGARPTADSDAGKIREWAAANGHEVSARGRIGAELREAYAAANPAA